ncbi:MAG TPA: HAMP domain-containing sensor histidine kinase [Myxococcales bacterium]
MRGLAELWAGFSRCYDPERLRREVRPSAVLAFAAFVLAVLFAMSGVDSVRSFTGFHHASELVALFVLGVCLDLASHRLWDRRTARDALALAGVAAYCAFVPLVMLATTSPTRYVFGLLFGQMAADYGRRFSFNWPMVGAVTALPLAIALIAWRDFALVVLVAFGAMMHVYASLTTRGQRRLVQEKAGLESAFELADRVASSSVDIAFSATLAEAGAFAHHLSNAMTPVLSNIRFVRETGGLDPEAREALVEAERGARRSVELLTRLLETLRARSESSRLTFELSETLCSLVGALSPASPAGAAAPPFAVRVEGEVPRFVVKGDPEHLRLALENLARNSREAGARSLVIRGKLLSAGEGVQLWLEDDGPGIPEPLRPQLLQALVTSQKSGGHGFGLYLSRRLVELLGGRLVLGASDHGAAFELQLPGSVLVACKAGG